MFADRRYGLFIFDENIFDNMCIECPDSKDLSNKNFSVVVFAIEGLW